MSNALAVATVTQALALLIEHNLHPEIDMAVSVETRKPPSDPPTEPTITVFLYQVTHNSSMRNNDLVTRASDGTLLKRPAAAIDLHFLISAYGEEQELVGQRLIGSVVRTLHEIPVLPRELIVEAAERPYLAGSDLAESPQKVRFTPTQMDVDETSKLWGMLNNTPYALSVAYQASLVLLDGHQKPAPARPVRRPEVTVVPEVPEVPPEESLPPAVPERSAGTGGAAGAAGAAGSSAAASAGTAAETAATDTRTGGTGDKGDAAAGATAAPAKRSAKKAAGARSAKSEATGGSSAGRPAARTRNRPRKATGGGAGGAGEAGGAGRTDGGGS
ncbi:hypothetical protein GCM10010211_56590 [Streptomyces albospinus]|uniref:Pvc16 N-terminal domain-containing protein n=1 Tax=Streptomyces albospinus TaxID=285515 RepID=A0ABQ2VFW9_9ACTN|nr:DUF4255 domain-containing protein [Streptomyces albospinus]GGU83288.1 hypothetical protein GCM10010211_56590 [Streptomyces albospinus]